MRRFSPLTELPARAFPNFLKLIPFRRSGRFSRRSDQWFALREDQEREDAGGRGGTRVARNAMGMARRFVPHIAGAIGNRRKRIDADLNRAFEYVAEDRTRMAMRRRGRARRKI